MNRSVLITGGSRGIGRATADAFLAQGDRVAVLSRNGGGPEDALALECDVTDVEQVDAAFKQAEAAHGPVEVLISNAGIVRDNLMLRMSPEDFTSVIDTNLTGPALLAKRALRGMLRAKRGRIVFISSAVSLRGEAGQANYAAAKAGLIGLARSLAREYGSRGITVNVVSPGLTDTDMAGTIDEAKRAELIGQIPLQRMAAPEEIAAAVAFISSPAASYITGAILPVDGGSSMGH
ncbi:3-oxoacyl-ACP reductase FabG [Streptomyces scabiei]|uniref:3-oxoacyl-ACP reductase FabG n=1 Tax=Streptomyces scabiei TaxID=1930 RepID=UPI0029B25A97|nr:3-oxoacyl-ACP reductase FabG [Streptomyces scabiei]MDX3165855.1 3-oxoacyl-ACP reductase FabG [Streptomyces scabiei]